MSVPTRRTTPPLPLALIGMAAGLFAAVALLTLTSPTAPLPDSGTQTSIEDTPPQPSSEQADRDSGEGAITIDTEPGTGSKPGGASPRESRKP